MDGAAPPLFHSHNAATILCKKAAMQRVARKLDATMVDFQVSAVCLTTLRSRVLMPHGAWLAR